MTTKQDEGGEGEDGDSSDDDSPGIEKLKLDDGTGKGESLALFLLLFVGTFSHSGIFSSFHSQEDRHQENHCEGGK